MTKYFLDTNIIIRYATQDDVLLSQKARRILKKIELGTIEATTNESVLSECVFVLSSKNLYGFTRTKVGTVLRAILLLQGLKIPHKSMYLQAIGLYVSSKMDFSDAVIAAEMQRQKITHIFSFDRHFDSIVGITRVEK